MPVVHAAVDALLRTGAVRLSWKGKRLKTRFGPYRIALFVNTRTTRWVSQEKSRSRSSGGRPTARAIRAPDAPRAAAHVSTGRVDLTCRPASSGPQNRCLGS